MQGQRSSFRATFRTRRLAVQYAVRFPRCTVVGRELPMCPAGLALCCFRPCSDVHYLGIVRLYVAG
eukprot:5637049-Alexandrium_andersonii.AAC.1